MKAFLVARALRLVKMLGRNVLKISFGLTSSSMALMWMKRFAPAALRRSQIAKLLIALVAAAVGFGAAGLMECQAKKQHAVDSPQQVICVSEREVKQELERIQLERVNESLVSDGQYADGQTARIAVALSV